MNLALLRGLVEATEALGVHATLEPRPGSLLRRAAAETVSGA